MFSHLYITVNSASTEQSVSYMVRMASPFHIFSTCCRMPIEVNHTAIFFQFCRTHANCDHWSITAHAFIHQTCMTTSCRSLSSIKLFDRRQTEVISHGYTFFTHLCKRFKSLLTKPMDETHPPSMSFQDTTFAEWHLGEHSASPCSHILQYIPHKDIWMPSTFMIC